MTELRFSTLLFALCLSLQRDAEAMVVANQTMANRIRSSVHLKLVNLITVPETGTN